MFITDYDAICKEFASLAKAKGYGCRYDADITNVAGCFYGKHGHFHGFDYDGSWLIISDEDGEETYRKHFDDPAEALKALNRSKGRSY